MTETQAVVKIVLECIQYGALGIFMGFVLLGVWKATKAFWAEAKETGRDVKKQWIESQKSRDLTNMKLLEFATATQRLIAEVGASAELSNENRYAALREHTDLVVKETRHHLSNALTRTESSLTEQIIDLRNHTDRRISGRRGEPDVDGGEGKKD